jgi:hypothetical protein
MELYIHFPSTPSWRGARLEKHKDSFTYTLSGDYTILVGKLERKRPVGRPRRRWEDNIRMDIREIGREGGDWVRLTRDRDQGQVLVNTIMNRQVP